MATTRMPKPLATRAISDPITPRPRMPTVLPFSSVGHWPRERRVPGTDHSHSRSGRCLKSTCSRRLKASIIPRAYSAPVESKQGLEQVRVMGLSTICGNM